MQLQSDSGNSETFNFIDFIVHNTAEHIQIYLNKKSAKEQIEH